MNIFVLVDSDDPAVQVPLLYDFHVVRMHYEALLMISHAYAVHGVELMDGYDERHEHHPSNLWVGSNATRLQWLIDYARALEAEATFRGLEVEYPGLLEDLPSPANHLPAGDLRPWSMVLAQECLLPRDYRDVPACYREYYVRWKLPVRLQRDKVPLEALWTNRPVPTFVYELRELHGPGLAPSGRDVINARAAYRRRLNRLAPEVWMPIDMVVDPTWDMAVRSPRYGQGFVSQVEADRYQVCFEFERVWLSME